MGNHLPTINFRQFVERPSVCATVVAAWLSALEVAGDQRDAITRAAGIGEWLLNQPGARIPAFLSRQLWDAIDTSSNDPLIGFRLGQANTAGQLFRLRYLVQMQEEIDDALGLLEHYFPLLTGCLQLRITQTAEHVELTVSAHPALRPHQLEIDFWMSWLAGIFDHRLTAHERRLARPRPDGFSQLSGHTARTLFDARHNQLVMQRLAIEAPVHGTASVTSEPLTQSFVTHAQAMSKPTTLEQVANFLLLDSRHGYAFEAVAEALSTTPRTLQRQLQNTGWSFSEMVDTIRKQLAADLLQHGSASIGDIAAALSYEETSNFIRAFSRWYQCTPSQFRKQLQQASTRPEITAAAQAGEQGDTSTTGGTLRCIVCALRADYDLDPALMLQELGLPCDLLEGKQDRIPMVWMQRIWRWCEQNLNDPDFPFRALQHHRPPSFFGLDLLLGCGNDIADSVILGCEMLQLWNNSMTPEIILQADGNWLMTPNRTTDKGVHPYSRAFLLASFIRMFEQQTGLAGSTLVAYINSADPDPGNHAVVSWARMGIPVRYQQRCNGIAFKAEYWHMSMPGSAPHMREPLEVALLQYLLEQQLLVPLELLRRVVAAHLPQATELAGLSALLRCSEQSLEAVLRYHDVSLAAVHDQARRGRARLLLQRDIPIADVAEQLGFSSPSGFAKAFRQWEGTTPMQFRQGSGKPATLR